MLLANNAKFAQEPQSIGICWDNAILEAILLLACYCSHGQARK
jgi:hypothetical protein